MSKAKKQSVALREMNRRLLETQYENMAIQMIQWEGMPDEIPKYAPERWLYTQGQATFFKIEDTGEYAILPVASGSVQLDIYGRPMTWRAFAVGASEQANYINSLELNIDNAVMIWNNQRHTADVGHINYLVNQMVNVDRTLDINTMLMRTPFVLKATDDNSLTMQNLIKNISDSDVFILKNENAGVDRDVDVLDLGIDFLGVELSEQYETYHDRILRYLGLDYLPVEKRERMVTDEANANNQELEVRRATRLEYRKVACDEIKKLFGVTITPKYVEVVNVASGQPDTDSQAMSGTPKTGTTDN